MTRAPKTADALNHLGGDRRTTDLVVNAIRDRVITGELVAGTRVSQDALAAEFNVSRTPVREAILRLQEEGFLEIIPYKGTVVRSISHGFVEEVYALRIQLEGLAARIGAPHLSDEQIRRMEAIERETDELSEIVNNPVFVELNRDFHYSLYEASQWSELVRFIDPMFSHGQRLTLHYQTRVPNDRFSRATRDEHGAILDACRRRDGMGAERAMRAHLIRACGLLLSGKLEFDELVLIPLLLDGDELEMFRESFE
ncbi:MAG: GntR family transcriptional regulator [Acidimicrobiia bacterium]